MAEPITDEAFARYINLIGNASIDQIEAAKSAQAEAVKNGTTVTLADVLVKQGVLTPAIKANIEKKLLEMQEGSIEHESGPHQIGNYKLLKKLGEGGMGAVYLADDSMAGRKVALKILPKRHASDIEFLTRFRREAKAAGKLNHINIVSAYGAGEESGSHFFAMEYCDGEPLDKILKREKTLSCAKALDITVQVASGLKHAHDHGLIHRDIKPENIFMTSEGVAKILDLGLSKNISETEQSFNTQTGVIMGTPHYISPEQACGDKHIDGRTDIYSLGATLYRMVTGTTPFHGSSAALVMAKHLSEELTNPQDINPEIPDGVVQLIRSMMAKSAQDRYENCDELLVDIELVVAGKMPSRQMIDEGKSSIAMRRSAVDRSSMPTRVGWNAGSTEEAPRSKAAAAKRNNSNIVVGVGTAVLVVAIIVYALIGRNGGTAIANNDNPKPAPNEPAPAVVTPKVEPVKQPERAKAVPGEYNFDFKTDDGIQKFRDMFIATPDGIEMKREDDQLAFVVTPSNTNRWKHLHLQAKELTYGSNWELRAKCDLHVAKDEIAKHENDSGFRGVFQLGFIPLDQRPGNLWDRYARLHVEASSGYGGLVICALRGNGQAEDGSRGGEIFNGVKKTGIFQDHRFADGNVKPPMTADGKYSIHATMRDGKIKVELNDQLVVDASLPPATVKHISECPFWISIWTERISKLHLSELYFKRDAPDAPQK